MYGTSGFRSSNWSGLLTSTHTLRAPYDALGAPAPPPWAPSCDSDDAARAMCLGGLALKSFIRVTPAMPRMSGSGLVGQGGKPPA